MTAELRPLSEVNHQATTILIREMGVVDALRFLGQFPKRSGDYTQERRKWLDGLSLGEVSADIKARRQRGQATS